MKKLLLISTILVVVLVPWFVFAGAFMFKVNYNFKEQHTDAFEIVTTEENLANYFLDYYYNADRSITNALLVEGQNGNPDLYYIKTVLTKAADDMTLVQSNGRVFALLSEISYYFLPDDLHKVAKQLPESSVFYFRIDDIKELPFSDNTEVVILINEQEIARKTFAELKENEGISLNISELDAICRGQGKARMDIVFRPTPK